MNNRIDELIKEKGYTYTSLAEKMGTTKQNLYGKLKSPSYPTLTEIAKALEVNMWELFASKEDITPSSPTLICPHCGKPIELSIKGNSKGMQNWWNLAAPHGGTGTKE